MKAHASLASLGFCAALSFVLADCASSTQSVTAQECEVVPASHETSAPSPSVIVVGGWAAFARGKLPPIHDGLPEHPNGLLVGLPGGLSFEYDAEDGRLIAVRRGDFVERTNWNERDGRELKPLGEIIFEMDVGDPEPWQATSARDPGKLQLDLAGLDLTDREARIEWVPRDRELSGVQRIVETLFEPKLEGTDCFGRTITIERAPGGASLWMPIAGRTGEPLWPVEPRTKFRPRIIQSSAAATSEAKRYELWSVHGGLGPIDCVNLSYQGVPGSIEPEFRGYMYDALCVWFRGEELLIRSQITLTIVVVRGKTSSGTLADNLERWSEELSR